MNLSAAAVLLPFTLTARISVLWRRRLTYS
jgi:hypothetical protein